MELFFVGLVVGLAVAAIPLELMRRGKWRAERKVRELMSFLGPSKSRYELTLKDKQPRRNRDGTDIL